MTDESTKFAIESNQNVLIRNCEFSDCVFKELHSPGTIIPSRPVLIRPDASVDDCARVAYTKAGKPPKTPKDFTFNIWNLAVAPLFKNNPDDPDFCMILMFDRENKSVSTSMLNPSVDCYNMEMFILHRDNEEALQNKFNKSFDELKKAIGFNKDCQFQESLMNGYDFITRSFMDLRPHLIYFDSDGNGTSVTPFKRNTNLNKVYEDIPCWYTINNSVLDDTCFTHQIGKYQPQRYYLFKKPMYYNLHRETLWPSIRTADSVADAVNEMGTIDDERNEVVFQDVESMVKQIRGELENEMIFRSQF